MIRSNPLTTIALFACTLFFPMTMQAAEISVDLLHDFNDHEHTFSAAVILSDIDEAINASQVVLAYPTDKLEVVAFSTSSSPFSLWPQAPTVDHEHGLISFIGGVPEAFLSEQLLLQTTFKVLAPGYAPIDVRYARAVSATTQTNVITRARSLHQRLFDPHSIVETFDTNRDGTTSLTELSLGLTR